MLSVSSQPSSSPFASFSVHGLTDVASNSPADLKFRDDLFMDLLAKMTLTPEQHDSPLPFAPSPVLPFSPSSSLAALIPALVRQGQSGNVELHLDLETAELGRLHLDVSLMNNRVSVHMQVRDDEAKRRVKEQLGALRSRFADMGLELAQFDVDAGNSGNPGQPAPELSADRAKTAAGSLPKLRKSRAHVANPETSVDIIA